ncbi:uncharacterized protein LOC126154494 [Schistocerca cancellata]|uniref:uncharacterized protein LOC126154494 n=1 Tax=Schistocerca cancellata TaxID=274614 RepID=UPI002117D267|nr:uncharacterized protein LOC126154494 [Schistocerca cancellata]
MIKKGLLSDSPNIVHIGPNLKKYLMNVKDNTFGIRPENNDYFIGNTKITFDYDDIIINDKKYIGTDGLLQLLTQKELNDTDYTEDDLNNYKEIAINTNLVYDKYDANSNKVKSSRGYKWMNILGPMWNDIKNNKKTDYFSKSDLSPYINKINNLENKICDKQIIEFSFLTGDELQVFNFEYDFTLRKIIIIGKNINKELKFDDFNIMVSVADKLYEVNNVCYPDDDVSVFINQLTDDCLNYLFDLNGDEVCIVYEYFKKQNTF